MLLTCKPEDLRDPVSALSFAKRAVEKNEGESPLYLDTLSLAYFMTGDTAKAIETQVKALALLPNEDSSVRTEMETNMAKFRAAEAEAQKKAAEQNQD
ncbi:MAG: hypothetical protein IIC02_06360 [Planctomycetes bacterium]|nr:hypothetical protein [Planctomycetota bacterium]